MILLLQAAPPGPLWAGDADAQPRLEAALSGALRSTAAFGAWPAGAWRVELHEDAAGFERATASPPQRAAAWVGDTLHLRPWSQLQRRDLGALLRHELTHRRLRGAQLHPWEEEARCIWAEGHTRPPSPWPAPPEARIQTHWDVALRQGSTAAQAWVYRSIRAWLEGRPLPAPPRPHSRSHQMTGGWHKDAALLADAVTVRWPEARVPRTIIINGKPFAWSIGAAPRRFEGAVRFSQGPVPQLQGEVDLVATSRGWSLRWTTDRAGWVAAATLGELGAGTPHEAQRAIAAVLDRWLDDPRHRHHDGTLCPLTHCAVIRGPGGPAALRAAVSAPHIKLNSHWMFFTGSSGGERLSVRAVWGMHGPKATASRAVEGDRWAEWTRSLSSSQVAILKRAVAPGLRPGQAGLMLGPSGPYAVEALRIACGRHFGWTLWPSNAVEAELRADGSLLLKGHGWGHNVGLDLALALDEARQGMKAEDILKEAFGPNAID